LNVKIYKRLTSTRSLIAFITSMVMIRISNYPDIYAGDAF
jgi:hypothetical protein